MIEAIIKDIQRDDPVRNLQVAGSHPFKAVRPAALYGSHAVAHLQRFVALYWSGCTSFENRPIPLPIPSSKKFLGRLPGSTTFMERRTLPRSSKPISLTQTLSPSLTTSEVLATRSEASCEMCTRPSRGPKKLTKAPKSAVLTTVPS